MYCHTPLLSAPSLTSLGNVKAARSFGTLLTALTTKAVAVGLTQNLMVAPITGPYMTLSNSNFDVPEPCEKSADKARNPT